MIRVGFILPHLRPGGAERCVINWLNALDRARFAPHLFLKRVEGGFLDLLPPDVRPIPLGGARAARLPRALGAALDAAGIGIAYSATNAMNLALLAASTRARRIVSEHTSPAAYLAEAKLAPLRRLAMRRYYPRADAVAVPTETIGRELATVIGRPLPLATLPNPVVAAIAPPRPPRVAGPIRILSAGRLVPAKGFDTLIDATAQALREGLDLRLDIVGEGPLHDDLAGRIAASGHADRVRLVGAADVAAALANADLFVLASRREGFGNVIVEAMAAGVPVIATSADGPAALIQDGRNGWLVPVDDTAALVRAIARFTADPGKDRVLEPARRTAARYGIATSTHALAALLAHLARTRSMAA